MSTSLKIVSIAFSIFIIFFILFLFRKRKVNIKYSLIWFILFALLFIATIIPGFLEFITKLLGFRTPSNMVVSLIISVLVIISISLTVIVSQQDRKIRLLIQEVSMLKKEK